MLRSFFVPKISMTITRTISQCQMLNEPISPSPIVCLWSIGPERLGPAEHVHMDMIHLLMPHPAGVDDGPEAVGGALLAREPPGSASILPSAGWCAGCASYSVATCSFGMIRKCTGASGRMSWKASTSSSS